MKKLIVAMVAGAFAMPAFAQPMHLGEESGFEDSYDNRGQCVSALAQGRNDRRKSGDRGSEFYNNLTGSEYNRESMRTTQCMQNDDGSYSVYFDPTGLSRD